MSVVPSTLLVMHISDTPAGRKARGAFFTPAEVTRHIADWAIRSSEDIVFEPSAGEAAFLLAAVDRLRELGAHTPTVHGVELHSDSALLGQKLVAAAGGELQMRVGDFFLTPPEPRFTAVIGNPPFIRFQDFAGQARDRARFAAQAQGVALSGLSSSWAAFVVHAAAQLVPGGRLGMVLPAELLSTNYAAPVRQFLLERFCTVELITFESKIFPDADADTVLVKADGWLEESSGVATLRQTRDAATLDQLEVGTTWTTNTPSARWTPLRLATTTIDALDLLERDSTFVRLGDLGRTKLGAVTGANKYFTLSTSRADELGIPRRDLVRVSPPGSAHLRGLELTDIDIERLSAEGAATWLLSPSEEPSAGTLDYINIGHLTGVDTAYKCRVRTPWWRVPLLSAPDMFLTYMNADTPRIIWNSAHIRHLNSIHGVYLNDEVRAVAHELLPIAALNSVTLLSAELVGRSYGGGVLKIEPREAEGWLMPGVEEMMINRDALLALKDPIQELLLEKRLLAAVALVDSVLLTSLTVSQMAAIRMDHAAFMDRRTTRGKSG